LSAKLNEVRFPGLMNYQ